MTSELSPAEKAEQFASFISLLSGEFDIAITFGGEPGPNRLVLPDITRLSSRELDFLYALCLREVGTLARSRRQMKDFWSFQTTDALFAAMTLDAARIERYLVRRFAGAGEVLGHHWGVDARDPVLGPVAFGFDPGKATAFQTFFQAVRWHFLGRPARFGWETLFGHWTDVVSLIDAPEITPLLTHRLATWEDARETASALAAAFYRLRGESDTSAPIEKPASYDVWQETLDALHKDLPEQLAPLLAQKEALQKEVEALKEALNARIAEQGIDLPALRKDLQQQAQANRALGAVARPMERQDRVRHAFESRVGRAGSVEQRTKERLEREQGRQESQQERAGAFEERANAIEQAALAREAAAMEKIDRQLDAVRAGLDLLAQELARPEIKDARRETLTQRQNAQQDKEKGLESRRQQLQEQAQERAQKAAEKSQALRDKADAARQKAEEAARRAGEAAASGASKAGALQEEMKALQAMIDALQEQIGEAAGKLGLKPEAIDPQALGSALSGGRESEQRMRAQIEGLVGDQGAIRQLQTAIRELDNQMRTQSHEVLSGLQEKMDEAGVPCDLVERFESMEGWAGADEVQKAFDQEATDETHRPVVNGSGGGKGHRDMLVELALKAEGINAIDPNYIFADVARLSPLSGFSESGARDGEGGVAASPRTHGAMGTSVSRHTVFSRQYDVVLPALVRDARQVEALRRDLGPSVRLIRDVFARKLKPSFKLRFRGGRDEGELDARAVWKLAARQGDDYFETAHRRPENKSSAVILVDVSGSMESIGDEAARRLQSVVLLLSEGLAASSVHHEVLGFAAPVDDRLVSQQPPSTFNRKSCRLETTVIRQFRDKGLDALLSLVPMQADNSDGESLRIALNRLSRQPGKTKLLFLVSDGKPFMHDADPEILDEDLRAALVEAARRKVVVIGVGFAPHPVLGEQAITLNVPEDLPRAIERFL